MSIVTVLFYFFEFLTAISAISILFVKNVFHAALLLIACLLSLAAVFVFANAEFIAVTQILIYAGGVVVLILFGIMLSSKFTSKPLIVTNQYTLLGLLVGGSLLAILTQLYAGISNNDYTPASSNNAVQHIGIVLMSDYVLPFEVAGLLLLIALLGAALISSSFDPNKNTPS
jgi:NADH:ubiquinone oxidoreductase subunit 6 (subunit J)